MRAEPILDEWNSGGDPPPPDDDLVKRNLIMPSPKKKTTHRWTLQYNQNWEIFLSYPGLRRSWNEALWWILKFKLFDPIPVPKIFSSLNNGLSKGNMTIRFSDCATMPRLPWYLLHRLRKLVRGTEKHHYRNEFLSFLPPRFTTSLPPIIVETTWN